MRFLQSLHTEGLLWGFKFSDGFMPLAFLSLRAASIFWLQELRREREKCKTLEEERSRHQEELHRAVAQKEHELQAQMIEEKRSEEEEGASWRSVGLSCALYHLLCASLLQELLGIVEESMSISLLST